MRIAQPLIDQILDRVDLVEVIGRRVQLKKSGKSYTACCPFHGEKTPSFHVHRDKGFYHCFGCQASGNAIGFLMNYEQRTFRDALNELAGLAGIELPRESDAPRPDLQYAKKISKPPLPPASPPNPATDRGGAPTALAEARQGGDDQAPGPWPEPAPFVGDDRDTTAADLEPSSGNLHDLLEAICLFYQQQLQQHAPARAYLHQRGLDGEACTAWRLGYAPEGWQHLEQAFPADVEGLRLLGLVRTSEQGRAFDLLRDRVIFPIRDGKGRVVGFGGRALDHNVKPKYINSPESVVFNKSRLLYGLYESRKARPQHWLLVEGYMDVIALHQAGLPGAVAALGTASNADHLNLLFRQSSRLTLAFDGDAAGQKAAWRTLELSLPLLTDGREVRFLVLPDGHDPDSLVRLEGLRGLETRLAQAPALSDFLYQQLAAQVDLSRPEGKAQLMEAARPLLALLPPQGTYRPLLRQSLRDRLGLSFLGRTKPQTSDAALSFEQALSHEDRLVLLLLLHPALVATVKNDLIAMPVAVRPAALTTLLDLLDQSQPWCPDDPDEALFFLLGAWPDDAGRQRLCALLERMESLRWPDTPARLKALCRDHVQHLQLRHLQSELHRVQGRAPLATVQAIRQQLNALQHDLHFPEESALPDG